jgi:ubiquinol-cytochrome c reductase iron-sulfur subunit
MSTVDDVDLGRRRFLTATATVVGGVGVAFVAVPFLKSWSPSERAQAAGAPVEADISKLEEGAMMTVEWRGKPVWLLKRSKKMLDDLPTLNDQLLDPKLPRWPASNPNTPRTRTAPSSPKPWCWSASVPISAVRLRSVPTWHPPIWGRTGKAAFSVPATVRFDLAGRVYKGVPRRSNLEVPSYRYLTDIPGVDRR